MSRSRSDAAIAAPDSTVSTADDAASTGSSDSMTCIPDVQTAVAEIELRMASRQHSSASMSLPSPAPPAASVETADQTEAVNPSPSPSPSQPSQDRALSPPTSLVSERVEQFERPRPPVLPSIDNGTVTITTAPPMPSTSLFESAVVPPPVDMEGVYQASTTLNEAEQDFRLTQEENSPFEDAMKRFEDAVSNFGSIVANAPSQDADDDYLSKPIAEVVAKFEAPDVESAVSSTPAGHSTSGIDAVIEKLELPILDKSFECPCPDSPCGGVTSTDPRLETRQVNKPSTSKHEESFASAGTDLSATLPPALERFEAAVLAAEEEIAKTTSSDVPLGLTESSMTYVGENKEGVVEITSSGRADVRVVPSTSISESPVQLSGIPVAHAIEGSGDSIQSNSATDVPSGRSSLHQMGTVESLDIQNETPDNIPTVSDIEETQDGLTTPKLPASPSSLEPSGETATVQHIDEEGNERQSFVLHSSVAPAAAPLKEKEGIEADNSGEISEKMEVQSVETKKGDDIAAGLGAQPIDGNTSTLHSGSRVLAEVHGDDAIGKPTTKPEKELESVVTASARTIDSEDNAMEHGDVDVRNRANLDVTTDAGLAGTRTDALIDNEIIRTGPASSVPQEQSSPDTEAESSASALKARENSELDVPTDQGELPPENDASTAFEDSLQHDERPSSKEAQPQTSRASGVPDGKADNKERPGTVNASVMNSNEESKGTEAIQITSKSISEMDLPIPSEALSPNSQLEKSTDTADMMNAFLFRGVNMFSKKKRSSSKPSTPSQVAEEKSNIPQIAFASPSATSTLLEKSQVPTEPDDESPSEQMSAASPQTATGDNIEHVTGNSSEITPEALTEPIVRALHNQEEDATESPSKRPIELAPDSLSTYPSQSVAGSAAGLAVDSEADSVSEVATKTVPGLALDNHAQKKLQSRDADECVSPTSKSKQLPSAGMRDQGESENFVAEDQAPFESISGLEIPQEAKNTKIRDRPFTADYVAISCTVEQAGLPEIVTMENVTNEPSTESTQTASSGANPSMVQDPPEKQVPLSDTHEKLHAGSLEKDLSAAKTSLTSPSRSDQDPQKQKISKSEMRKGETPQYVASAEDFESDGNKDTAIEPVQSTEIEGQGPRCETVEDSRPPALLVSSGGGESREHGIHDNQDDSQEGLPNPKLLITALPDKAVTSHLPAAVSLTNTRESGEVDEESSSSTVASLPLKARVVEKESLEVQTADLSNDAHETGARAIDTPPVLPQVKADPEAPGKSGDAVPQPGSMVPHVKAGNVHVSGVGGSVSAVAELSDEHSLSTGGTLRESAVKHTGEGRTPSAVASPLNPVDTRMDESRQVGSPVTPKFEPTEPQLSPHTTEDGSKERDAVAQKELAATCMNQEKETSPDLTISGGDNTAIDMHSKETSKVELGTSASNVSPQSREASTAEVRSPPVPKRVSKKTSTGDVATATSPSVRSSHVARPSQRLPRVADLTNEAGSEKLQERYRLPRGATFSGTPTRSTARPHSNTNRTPADVSDTDSTASTPVGASTKDRVMRRTSSFSQSRRATITGASTFSPRGTKSSVHAPFGSNSGRKASELHSSFVGRPTGRRATISSSAPASPRPPLRPGFVRPPFSPLKIPKSKPTVPQPFRLAGIEMHEKYLLQLEEARKLAEENEARRPRFKPTPLPDFYRSPKKPDADAE